ncbi:MAG: thioredoxin domain-containing protein [Planctomycetia bacterium]|nr:thioredoxin domain-containing protein [Planctomycetia bacterium]
MHRTILATAKLPRCGLLFLLLGWLVTPAAGQEAKEKDPKKKPANALAKESSPYLLQHAHNPVNWHPWGEAAFAKAKKEGKLVFLSIGYSSCHWCHVMEKESFNNEAVAKLMNEWFICIKVDREERPDVDQIYMTALNALGQRGGWPLSMWLTADGKPIIGGTYWPPEDKEIDGEKINGFKTIMKLVQDFHTKQPKDIEAQADKLATATTQALAGLGRGINLAALDRALVNDTLTALHEEFDKTHGGFGSAARLFKGTKFPTPPYLMLLLNEAGRDKKPEVDAMLTVTLDHMARGGIYDHLGGGFHRYSTERTWTVPHFEKMLYDNAQLVEAYSKAYRQTKNPLYRRVVAESLDFIQRELTDKSGGFYSALDADSEDEEGRFYVWTPKDLTAALAKEELTLLEQVYGNDGSLNFEDKYIILRLRKPLAEVAKDLKLSEEDLEKRLAPIRKKLFEVRAQRERPFLDTKVLTAWNGQMIAGYATAGQVFENKNYLEAASKAADFLLQTLRTKDGRLLRTYGARPGEKPEAKLNAYLDDYAYLVHGLLNLHDATNDKKWLDASQALTDKMVELFEDKDRGGFFYTSHDHEKLFARGKDQYDGAQPGANSVAAKNLVRLWQKTNDDKYRTQAEKSLKNFSLSLKTAPTSMTTMTEALSLYLTATEKAPKK